MEHRHEDIEAAIGRLVDVAAALDNTGPIDDYCHKLLIEVRPSRENDIALLVLRAKFPATNSTIVPPTRASRSVRPAQDSTKCGSRSLKSPWSTRSYNRRDRFGR